MKKAYKIGGIFVAVLLYMLLLLLQVQELEPELNDTIPSMDVTGMGTFLAAENKLFYQVVYEMDSDGEIVNQFYKKNYFWNRRERLTDIFYSQCEDRVYLLSARENKRNHKVEYRVYRLTSDWSSAERIGTISKKKAFCVKDFNVVEGAVYVTGVDTKKDKLLVYALDTEEVKTAELVMERGATKEGEGTQNIQWADAAFSGKTLYGLSNRGQLLEYNQDNAEPFKIKDMGEVTWIRSKGNDVVYHNSMEDTYTSIEESPFLEILEGQQGVVSVSYEKDNGYSFMLRQKESGDKEVLIYMDEEEYCVDKIITGAFNCVKRFVIVAIGLAVAFVIVFAFGTLLWCLGQKLFKKPALVLGIVLENVALVIGVCLFLYHTNVERIQESYNVSAITYLTGEQAKCKTLMEAQAEMIPDEFAVSQWFEPMKTVLTDWSVQQKDDISYEIDLVEYREEESQILYSSQNAYGRNIYGIYPKEVLEKLHKMKNKEKADTLCVEKEGTCIYAIQFLEENENNHLVWVAKMKIAP